MLLLSELSGGAHFKISGQNIMFTKLGNPIDFRLYENPNHYIFQEINAIDEKGHYCSLPSNTMVEV